MFSQKLLQLFWLWFQSGGSNLGVGTATLGWSTEVSLCFVCIKFLWIVNNFNLMNKYNLMKLDSVILGRKENRKQSLIF